VIVKRREKRRNVGLKSTHKSTHIRRLDDRLFIVKKTKMATRELPESHDGSISPDARRVTEAAIEVAHPFMFSRMRAGCHCRVNLLVEVCLLSLHFTILRAQRVTT
jgi:hypothetical protein